MIMITTEKGELEIKNLPKYNPFLLEYEDLDDAIQVDCTGLGALNFFDPFNKELELEINTNINNALNNYGKKTGHNASNIGYSLTLIPTNKLDRQHNVVQMGVELTIIFKKPVPNASSYSLTPSISLITSIILGEIFILKQ